MLITYTTLASSKSSTVKDSVPRIGGSGSAESSLTKCNRTALGTNRRSSNAEYQAAAPIAEPRRATE